MDQFLINLQNITITQYAIFIPLFLIIYFLPAILAFMFNKKYLKIIAVANIPAGFSMIAWFALIIFAITGNASDKLIEKLKLNKGELKNS